MRLAGACQAGEHVLQCHALREPEGVKGGGMKRGEKGGLKGGTGWAYGGIVCRSFRRLD